MKTIFTRMKDYEKDSDKVIKVINSCKTIEQLKVAYKMVELYRRKWYSRVGLLKIK